MQYMSEKSFRSKITLVNFVMCFIIMFQHSYNIRVYDLTAESDLLGRVVYYFEVYIRTITDYAVPMFFMISGYLFFRTFELKKIIQKYWSRIKSILMPFLVWCTFYYLFYAMLVRIPFFAERMTANEMIPLNLATWIARLWDESFYVFWFIKFLIILIALTPVWYFLLKDWFPGFGLIALTFFFLYSIGRASAPFHLRYINIYYLLGAYIGINYKDLPKCNNKIPRIIAIIGLILLCLNMIEPASREATEVPVIRGLLLCVCTWLAFPEPKKDMPWWCQITFFIYCIHDLILEITEKIWLLLAGKGPIQALIDYIVMPAITMVIVILIAWLLKRFLKPVWFVLSGGR